MKYNYNPHRHVKIWLSKNPAVFLGLENQLRLIRMRELNPNADISFVYDSKLLSADALNQLKSFCAKYHLIPYDVRDLLKECNSYSESMLASLYEEEINSVHSGGNLGAASDKLRWLSPIYALGTYTDFDVSVRCHLLGETIEIESDLLLDIGTVVDPLNESIEHPVINNDIIAVIDSQSAAEKIEAIRKNILIKDILLRKNHYQFIERTHTQNIKNLFQLYYSNTFKRWGWLSTMLIKYLTSRVVNIYQSLDPTYLGLKMLPSVEEKVLNSRSTISERLSDDFIIEHVFSGSAETYKNKCKKQLTWFNRLTLPPQTYEVFKKLALIENDQQLIAETREIIKSNFLKVSVMVMTGPNMLSSTLLESCPPVDELKKSSIYHYKLGANIVSENSVKIREPSQRLLSLIFQETTKDISDLSWLEIGEKKIQSNEKKVASSVQIIQKLRRDKRQERASESMSTPMVIEKKTDNQIRNISNDDWILKELKKAVKIAALKYNRYIDKKLNLTKIQKKSSIINFGTFSQFDTSEKDSQFDWLNDFKKIQQNTTGVNTAFEMIYTCIKRTRKNRYGQLSRDAFASYLLDELKKTSIPPFSSIITDPLGGHYNKTDILSIMNVDHNSNSILRN